MNQTVCIKNSSKLQYIQGYIVVFDGEKETRIFLKDISIFMIESTRTLITIPLIIELIKNNIVTIFCDEKHNPIGFLDGISNNYFNSGNIYNQLEWKNNRKNELWCWIVKEKIKMQMNTLHLFNLEEKIDILSSYINEVKNFDELNREGLAAKVYFYSLFGSDFSRGSSDKINMNLNYGYALLASAFNREIIARGYLTQLGIFHKGKQNKYNLTYDFLEPFRAIVDILVYIHKEKEDLKEELRKIFTYKIILDDEERYLDNAIDIYCLKLLSFLSEEADELPTIKLKEKNYYVSLYENYSNV